MILQDLEEVISLVDSHQVCPKTSEHHLPAAYLYYLYLTVVEISAEPLNSHIDEDFLPSEKRKVVQAIQRLDFILLQMELQQNDPDLISRV